MPLGVRVLAKPMKYCSSARLTLSRSLCICSSGSICRSLTECPGLQKCSARNKFEHFSQMIRDKLDVLIIAETKLDSSFPSSQFTINGFKAPIRLDITRNSGGLLVYSREDILCRKIEGLEIPKDIQAIPIEINIRKQKWLLLPIYRSPTQDPFYFVDNVCRIIDGYALSRENVLLIGDFNMEVGDRALSPLINTYHLFNLLKGPTCFKTSRGRSIDLILTNKKHSFMKSQSFETGFSRGVRSTGKVRGSGA